MKYLHLKSRSSWLAGLAALSLGLAWLPAASQNHLMHANTQQSAGGTPAATPSAAMDDLAKKFAADKPEKLQPFYYRLYADGEWGAVLNFEQLGLAAMELGYLDLAKRSFDQAIARIYQIYADDPNAKKALSVFSEEKVKDFKGEPFERAMAYYYRGLLYAADGDYQNARASFLAADLQTTMSEKERYAGDFGLMKYLAGWASACAKDESRSKSLIGEAKKSDSSIGALPDAPGTAILLIDSGLGPSKIGKGEYKELLAFEGRGDPDNSVVVKGANGSVEIRDFTTGGDVYRQATTRNGREIDVVLNGKASFKGNTDQAGDAAVAIGSSMAMASLYNNNTNLGMAGGVIAIVGLIAKGVAAATTPEADTRYWASLPGSVMMVTANLEPSPGLTMVSSASPVEKVLPLQVSQGSCWIGWGRTRSALTDKDGGVVTLASASTPQESGREKKNQQMRAMLISEFGATQVGASKTASSN